MSWSVSNKTNENIRVPTERDSYNTTILRKIPKADIPSSVKIYREPFFNYKNLPSNDNIGMEGYFQSAKYFNHHRAAILELFYEFYPEVSSYIDKIFNQVINEHTVSIHVRRADYLKLSDTHPVQSIEYYKNAIECIQQTYPDIYLIIFSDDIKWCKEQALFNTFPKKHFMETHSNDGNSEMDTIFDLYCMARCNDNIICNSSFSWWASYLNKNSNKIIIAPKMWFGPRGTKNWNDIYTEDMVLL
jgi:hypothetical protein